MHVVVWLASTDVPDVAPAFILHNIDGPTLLAVSDDALKELDVASAVDRIKLLGRVKVLCSGRCSRSLVVQD